MPTLTEWVRGRDSAGRRLDPAKVAAYRTTHRANAPDDPIWAEVDALPGDRWEGPALPSLARRALNFGKAVAKHAADGFRRATEAEIEGRLAVCRGCDLFTGTHCGHEACGCSCGGGRKFLNKLAWRSESCPDGKWPSLPAPD